MSTTVSERASFSASRSGPRGSSSTSVTESVKMGPGGSEAKVTKVQKLGDGTEVVEEDIKKVTVNPSTADGTKTVTVYGTRTQDWKSAEFIVYLIVTIVALIVIIVIGWVDDSRSYWNSLTRPSYGSNLAWQAVVLVLAVLALGVASFLFTAALNPNGGGGAFRVFLYVCYGLQLVLLIVTIAVLFRQKSLSSTFYLMIVLVIITFFQGCAAVILMWKAPKMPLYWLALFLWILFVVWLVYETVFSYQLMTSN
jgi:cation transport ATPase